MNLNPIQTKAIETIELIKAEAKAGHLGAMTEGACMYRVENVPDFYKQAPTYQHCAIGALLTPEELDLIESADMNGSGSSIFYEEPNNIWGAVYAIGERLKSLGLSRELAQVLQEAHDSCFSQELGVARSIAEFIEETDNIIEEIRRGEGNYGLNTIVEHFGES